MIQSFANKDTQRVWARMFVRRLGPEVTRMAHRKLQALDAAQVLSDLASPPGNRLEPLAGNRAGQHSIRINDQYRVCFIWTPTGPADVEITDYH
ncbi:type II toxin-antitoxin system RelE/ParE family toxin [Gordonia sp. DT30]|uniref:type II toxin-antitoxin system RelE/ParE family toxin n=1 Tax=unclassified Gordonia (in: high G+C Gram-positive bacteria) TaxID=2657482 RepID=UPI003CEB9A64